MEVTKSKVVVIGDSECNSVHIDGIDLTPVDRLRFLGVGIGNDGILTPWME